MHHDPFHVGLIRDKLTRNLVSCFSDICDEIDAACGGLVPASRGGSFAIFQTENNTSKTFILEWLPISLMSVARLIVARTNGRIFVGRLLCRQVHVY